MGGMTSTWVEREHPRGGKGRFRGKPGLRQNGGLTVRDLELMPDMADVPVMGGDEIRALTPAQRSWLLSVALQSAARLQAYADELGDPEPFGAGGLIAVDTDDPDEAGVVWTWMGAQVGSTHARGVVRTRDDFDQAADTAAHQGRLGARPAGAELTAAEKDAAWERYKAGPSDIYQGALDDVEAVLFAHAVHDSF